MDLGQLIIIVLLLLLLIVIISFIILLLFKKLSNKNSNNSNYAPYNSNNNTNILSTGSYTRAANMPYGVKVNIRARNGNSPPQYATIGTLYESQSGTLLKLVGKEVYRGSQKWYYYALSSDYNPNRLTVIVGDKECSKEYGCVELYDNDIVKVKEYGGKNFTVQLYPKETIHYIPYIY